MPLRIRTEMEQRLEWVLLASKRSLSLGDLSHGAGVCRKMLYNWQRRFESEGREGLIDLSTTPLVSPERTSEEMERGRRVFLLSDT